MLSATSTNLVSSIYHMIDYLKPYHLVGIQSTLSIVTPFWHNANFEKVGIIGRCDYRQGKILMSYYANWQRRGVIIDRVLYGVTIDEGIIDRGRLYLATNANAKPFNLLYLIRKTKSK